MRHATATRAGGFTLIEIMMAMAIFALVLGAIYACWTLILKSSKLGLAAAAQVQRERISVRTIEDALTSTRSFAADLQHYGFVAENGDDAVLSFVARLPKSFPRSGKFGDFDVRRVTFSVESGQNSERALVMRQNPILMDPDIDEKEHPLVLARGVSKLLFEFWDSRLNDWADAWTQTNQLPKLVKVTVEFGEANQRYSYSQKKEQVTRIVALPSVTVPASWQTPGGPGHAGNAGNAGQAASASPSVIEMRTAFHQNQNGIALIIVMISITVLSILAAGFAYSMKVETKLAQNANSETEMTWLGLSGVELARYVVAQQLTIAQEPYDSLNQKWAGGPGSLDTSNSVLAGISLENYELGNGKFSVKITDLERKVNINSADQETLERALRLVGVDAGDFSAIGSSILDWIDPDDNMHIGGTESDYYQSLDPPYYAKNRPVDDLSELLLVRGVTPDIFWGGVSTNHQPAAFQTKLGLVRSGSAVAYPVGLADLFTPISSGRININTASLMTLQMIPLVDENIASEIIRLRSGPDGADGTEDDTPFRNAGELVNAGLSRQVVQQLSRFCDVRSRTFEVEVNAEIGSYKRQFFAILGRNSNRDVQVLSFCWK